MTATLDGLIRDVQQQSDDALAQLEAAAQKAGELSELGDALLTHFVDRCRRAGHTWAEIGAHLGVTRQAVQKRFIDAIGNSVTFERFTMRAIQAVDRAQDVAVGLNHSYVGTEHQLLALFDVGDGIAARVLASVPVTREAVEREVLSRVVKGETPVSHQPPLTPRARKVLEEAVNVALELGHNYVGTEHLLLGLYRGQSGFALEILEQLGAARDQVKAKVIELLAGLTR